MNDSFEITCPKCKQKLRIPKKIGGVVMACPSCGEKFYSDFKIGNKQCGAGKNVATEIFTMPLTLFEKLLRMFKG